VDAFPTLTHRRDIDGLRAIAVLAVLGFHAFPASLPSGFVGVDVFFVISGFLITGILLRAQQLQGRVSLRQFYQQRINRIFPALLLVLAASLVAGWWGLMPPEFKQLGAQTAAGAGFASNILFWQQAGYFDAAAQSKPLLHLWSLGVEEQYYLLWPLLILLLGRQRRALLSASLGLCLLSLALNCTLLASQPDSSFYLLHTRFWELLAGGLLAMHGADDSAPSAPKPWAHVAGFAGLLLIAAAVALLGAPAPYPGWRALLPVAGSVLVIAAGPHGWPNRYLLGNRLLVGVGLISYPLYLWHWPLLVFAKTLLPQQAALPAVLAGLLLAATVLAWATYRWLEQPVRHAQRLGRGPRQALVLAVLMGAVASAGYMVFLQDGLASRYPQPVRHLVDFRYDHLAAYRTRECFIDRIEDLDRALNFSPACVDAPLAGQPLAPLLLLLWGDSTAAHLLPGLRAEQARRAFRLAQFTAASCPPVLGYKPNALCAQVNAATAQRITQIHPDVAVLSGLSWTPQDQAEIAATVQFLKAQGARKVVIVGSPPRWVEAPPRLLYRAMLADPQHRIPSHLSTGLQGSNEDLDKVWAQLAHDTGADYVSAYQALCNARQGCIARTGDAPQDIIGWDSFHLTTTGSALLLARIMPALLPDAGKGKPP
jgi:peptidoglycan/LPS O-acetylase OafA/YrhL